MVTAELATLRSRAEDRGFDRAARAAAPSASYAAQVEALSRASVHKYYRAFHDIDWDAPENALDPNDPRLELRATESARTERLVPARSRPRSAPSWGSR